MRVLADRNRGDAAADVGAVLDDRVVGLQLADCELVADRDVVSRANLDLLVLVHDPSGQLLAGFQAFYDHDPDRVVLIMDHEVNHEVARKP